MSTHFIHIGKFKVSPEQKDTFIKVMRDYKFFATQNGLDHSHLVEDEKDPATFMHVTVWASRDDWVAIEKTAEHKAMHQAREALLTAPMDHDFVCGDIIG